MIEAEVPPTISRSLENWKEDPGKTQGEALGKAVKSAIDGGSDLELRVPTNILKRDPEFSPMSAEEFRKYASRTESSDFVFVISSSEDNPKDGVQNLKRYGLEIKPQGYGYNLVLTQKGRAIGSFSRYEVSSITPRKP